MNLVAVPHPGAGLLVRRVPASVVPGRSRRAPRPRSGLSRLDLKCPIMNIMSEQGTRGALPSGPFPGRHPPRPAPATRRSGLASSTDPAHQRIVPRASSSCARGAARRTLRPSSASCIDPVRRPQERPVGRIRTRRPVAVDRAPVRRTLESLWLAMGRSVATSPGDPGDRLLSRHSSSRADADRGFKGGTPRPPCLLCAEVMLPHRASCEYRVCHHSALSGFPGRIPARRAGAALRPAPRLLPRPCAGPGPLHRGHEARPPRRGGATRVDLHASGPSGSKGPRALPRARAGVTRSPADTAMTRRPAARTRVRPADDGAAPPCPPPPLRACADPRLRGLRGAGRPPAPARVRRPGRPALGRARAG